MLVSGIYTWEYTNSPDFCGMTCHSMPPEYMAYQQSPHAQVKCVECHIGREAFGNQFTRKAGDIRHVLATAFKTYEYPLKVKSLRPAPEICERCHSPEKFSDDSQRVIVHYEPDVENTLYRTYLLLKTGGGTARQGLGRGIHWHIENQVLYYATDENAQEIPYVRVINGEEGTSTEYVDISTDFIPYKVDQSELQEMDCVTCHNRISHAIYQPEESVDKALFRKIISPDIPEIRRKAVEALRRPYDSAEQARRGMAQLTDFYRADYPDYYDLHGEEITQAVNLLQEIYAHSNFPEQMVTCDTHPNNMGHETDPGCFRCHDGKHLDGSGAAIRLECNLCHAIPVISGPDDLITLITIDQGRQPTTHKNPNWIALHRFVFDENDENETCSSCHDTSNYSQADNTSFCSNSACHANNSNYLDLAALDEPDVRAVMLEQLPHYPKSLPPVEAWADSPSLDTIHQDQEGLLCRDCHDPFPPVGPPANEVCIACHGETPDGVQELTTYLEPNPHDGHEGGLYCSYCHRNFGPYRSPCSFCHEDVPVVPKQEAASSR
jgi:nitrate/TMAO reductase-like tetraheme cytochrome c subunit